MTLLDWLEAILKLGLPMLAVSWLVFRWAFRRGDIQRDSDHRALTSRLKEMKGSFKADKSLQPHFLYRRWMSFGGGFYGLTALWTFVVIELLDLLRFVFNPVTTLNGLGEGAPEIIVNLILNQLGNFISAVVWFVYWSQDLHLLLTLGVAWMGYWCGIKLAQRETAALHLDRMESRMQSGIENLKNLLRRRNG